MNDPLAMVSKASVETGLANKPDAKTAANPEASKSNLVDKVLEAFKDINIPQPVLATVVTLTAVNAFKNLLTPPKNDYLTFSSSTEKKEQGVTDLGSKEAIEKARHRQEELLALARQYSHLLPEGMTPEAFVMTAMGRVGAFGQQLTEAGFKLKNGQRLDQKHEPSVNDKASVVSAFLPRRPESDKLG